MTGGLKTTGRLAIAAMFCAIGGMPGVGGQAEAADLGGDCCADLEERVAELEATTVRKGNKKVKVELYGRVNRVINFWDDGAEQNVYVDEQFLQLHPLRREGQGQDQRQLVERLPDRNRGRRQSIQVRQPVQRQHRQRSVERPQVSHLSGEQAATARSGSACRRRRRTTSPRIRLSSRVSIRPCMPTST